MIAMRRVSSPRSNRRLAKSTRRHACQSSSLSKDGTIHRSSTIIHWSTTEEFWYQPSC